MKKMFEVVSGTVMPKVSSWWKSRCCDHQSTSLSANGPLVILFFGFWLGRTSAPRPRTADQLDRFRRLPWATDRHGRPRAHLFPATVPSRMLCRSGSTKVSSSVASFSGRSGSAMAIRKRFRERMLFLLPGLGQVCSSLCFKKRIFSERMHDAS